MASSVPLKEVHPTDNISARKIVLSGRVQGVGFRPFIYRLAIKHHLVGWIRNCTGTVEIHVQGQTSNIKVFLSELFIKKPTLSKPILESDNPTTIGEFNNFSIQESQNQGSKNISVPIDLFLCDDCLNELNNPTNRRYRYPFINCTQCGPRYTLIQKLPYDRINTTMSEFQLCPQCRDEYEDPGNRRFHAEPVACPVCGPELSFSCNNEITNGNEPALHKTIEQLRQGKIIAVKGIGGYHLMCDARNNEAVSRLRRKKHRPDKPFAVMFPAPIGNSFQYVEQSVAVNENDKAFLLQPARPILLVAKRPTSELSEYIAPGLNEIGIMLPYSPLHHLLLNDFGAPLIATSANISGEPVLISNDDVEQRLLGIAEAFLHHNRQIERPADDPVYRTIAHQPRPVRIGRGIAPVELSLPFNLVAPVLAVGAHVKNTITIAWKNRAVISPHIGEMESARSLQVFGILVNDLQHLYGIEIERILCDAHPGYTTTHWANNQALPIHQVYHHHAHASAAYYECMTDQEVIAFTWDGVGYGEDGSLWGGETLIGKPGQWERVASMRPFYLPGGGRASREPWRSAASVCWETGQVYEAIPGKNTLLHQAWQQKVNTPKSSSIGRLFDAAAALINACSTTSYEAQAAMQLETLAHTKTSINNFIELPLNQSGQTLITDWQPLLKPLLNTTMTKKERAILFHSSLAHAMLEQAKIIRDRHNINIISLSGGVFQNRLLTEYAIELITASGFEVYLPQLIPVNDAGISFGQIMEYGFSHCK